MAEIDGDTDTEDGELPPPHLPLTICLPLHAIQSALPDIPQPQQPNATVVKTMIPLKSLFIFPSD